MLLSNFCKLHAKEQLEYVDIYASISPAVLYACSQNSV